RRLGRRARPRFRRPRRVVGDAPPSAPPVTVVPRGHTHPVEIAGRVALVTGAGAGIGRATALRLAREGAAVGVADFDDGAGRETVGEIEAESGRAGFVHVDVAREADVRAMIDYVVRT